MQKARQVNGRLHKKVSLISFENLLQCYDNVLHDFLTLPHYSMPSVDQDDATCHADVSRINGRKSRKGLWHIFYI
jgi:hypothetical protein